LSVLRENSQEEIDAILAKYPTKRSAVLPLCHLAQKQYEYMSPEAIRDVADLLELDPTEVQSLVGFYSLLRERPTGKYVIEICADLPCALRGANRLVDHVCKKLGVQPGETTPDGLITVEKVMCVAACHRAPVAQINLEYFEHLDPDRFDALLEELISSLNVDKGDTRGDSRPRV
jgi:NADH-quinone oxidoreductase E subunit